MAKKSAVNCRPSFWASRVGEENTFAIVGEGNTFVIEENTWQRHDALRSSLVRALCQAAAVKMRPGHGTDRHDNLASTRRSLPEVFDSPCQAATVKMGFNTQEPARGLRLAMPGSDGEDAGFNTQEPARGLRLAMSCPKSSTRRYARQRRR